MFARYQNYTGYYFEINTPVFAEDVLPEHLDNSFCSMPNAPQNWLLNYRIAGQDGKDLSNSYKSTTDTSYEINLDSEAFSAGKEVLLQDPEVKEMMAFMQEKFGADCIKVKFGVLSYEDD